MQATNPTIEALAVQFIEELRETISADDMDKVNARNVTPDYFKCCATHDFCDANQCMIDALEHFGLSFDTQSEAQIDLINSAWNLAKACEFNAESVKNTDKR